MLGLVRSYAQGAEPQGRPKTEACQLTAFSYSHFVLPREEGSGAGHAIVVGDFQRSRDSRAAIHQTWLCQEVPARTRLSLGLTSTQLTPPHTHCHKAYIHASHQASL